MPRDGEKETDLNFSLQHVSFSIAIASAVFAADSFTLPFAANFSVLGNIDAIAIRAAFAAYMTSVITTATCNILPLLLATHSTATLWQKFLCRECYKDTHEMF
jgi:hypothetical protein